MGGDDAACKSPTSRPGPLMERDIAAAVALPGAFHSFKIVSNCVHGVPVLRRLEPWRAYIEIARSNRQSTGKIVLQIAAVSVPSLLLHSFAVPSCQEHKTVEKTWFAK